MKIFDIELQNLQYIDFFKEITKLEKQQIVFTPNPEMLLRAKDDQEFTNILKKATFLTSDGIGLYIAYQMLEERNKLMRIVKFPYYLFNLFFRKYYLYQKYGERICGSDITKDLLYYSESQKVAITILDLYNPHDQNKVESQKIFSQRLQELFPQLSFDYIIYNPENKSTIIEQIKQSPSKILFSTLGMKKQEQSVIEVMEQCSNIKLGLGIGSSFDYFVGFQKRAPEIFSSLGIEWFYRICTGPQKINRLKRLYNAIFVFIQEVFKQN